MSEELRLKPSSLNVYDAALMSWVIILLAGPATAQISGNRVAIIDDYAVHGPYAFYGDTHQPTAWLPVGTFVYNGATASGAVVSGMNDGGRNWLADMPSCEGNVFLTKLPGIDYANPSRHREEKFSCLSGRYDSQWAPAPTGTCTAGYNGFCDWKSRNPFSVDGKLYLFVYRQEGPGNFFSSDATLIMSADRGATWANPAHVGVSTNANGDYPAGPGDDNYPSRHSLASTLPRTSTDRFRDGNTNVPGQ